MWPKLAEQVDCGMHGFDAAGVDTLRRFVARWMGPAILSR